MSKSTGIYAIYHEPTCFVYIGQSVNLHHREYEHFWALKKGQHHCQFLQRVFDKYAQEGFHFFILEEADPKELTEREQFWMDYFRFLGTILFNSAPAADSMLGFRHSEETKQKMSKTKKGKPKPPGFAEQISKIHTGKTVSAETREKLAQAGRGRKLSEETRKKMSASRTGKKHSEDAIAKRVAFHTGRKRSAETCKKISEAKRRAHDEKKNQNVKR